jgi:hypothetical protein
MGGGSMSVDFMDADFMDGELRTEAARRAQR